MSKSVSSDFQFRRPETSSNTGALVDSGELDQRAFPEQKEVLKLLPFKVNWLIQCLSQEVSC